jgi:hypothetical protein
VEADEVDRGGGEGVLQADFVEAGVSGLMDASGRGDLVDGAFDSGAGAVDLIRATEIGGSHTRSGSRPWVSTL